MNLPALIRERRIRDEVHVLPPLEFSGETLTSEREWQRAYVLVTFLAQAYMWMEGERGLPDRVPEILAVPWKETADHWLPLPHMLQIFYTTGSYLTPVDQWMKTTFILCQPLLGRRMSHGSTWWTYSGGASSHARTEGYITHAYCSVMNHDHQGLAQDLLTVRDTLERMLETLLKMYEQCDPKVFFVKICPFQAGSKGLQAFPAGLLYKGLNPKPLHYHGSSAAQSSSVHVRCVLRGDTHRQ